MCVFRVVLQENRSDTSKVTLRKNRQIGLGIEQGHGDEDGLDESINQLLALHDSLLHNRTGTTYLVVLESWQGRLFNCQVDLLFGIL